MIAYLCVCVVRWRQPYLERDGGGCVGVLPGLLRVQLPQAVDTLMDLLQASQAVLCKQNTGT